MMTMCEVLPLLTELAAYTRESDSVTQVRNLAWKTFLSQASTSHRALGADLFSSVSSFLKTAGARDSGAEIGHADSASAHVMLQAQLVQWKVSYLDWKLAGRSSPQLVVDAMQHIVRQGNVEMLLSAALWCDAGSLTIGEGAACPIPIALTGDLRQTRAPVVCQTVQVSKGAQAVIVDQCAGQRAGVARDNLAALHVSQDKGASIRFYSLQNLPHSARLHLVRGFSLDPESTFFDYEWDVGAQQVTRDYFGVCDSLEVHYVSCAAHDQRRDLRMQRNESSSNFELRALTVQREAGCTEISGGCNRQDAESLHRPTLEAMLKHAPLEFAVDVWTALDAWVR